MTDLHLETVLCFNASLVKEWCGANEVAKIEHKVAIDAGKATGRSGRNKPAKRSKPNKTVDFDDEESSEEADASTNIKSREKVKIGGCG